MKDWHRTWLPVPDPGDAHLAPCIKPHTLPSTCAVLREIHAANAVVLLLDAACCCLLHACHNQLLVRAAYEGALAHPLIPDPENLQHLTPETLATFVAQNYTGVWGTAARGLTKVRLVESVGSSLFPKHICMRWNVAICQLQSLAAP